MDRKGCRYSPRDMGEAVLVKTAVFSRDEDTRLAAKHVMYVMLLILQPNNSNKEWGAVSRGSSVHLSCLGCSNLDNNYSGGLRSPSLIQLY